MKSKIRKFTPFVIFFSFILWLIILADLDRKNVIMDIGHAVPAGDKIGHFLLFGILALLLNMTCRFRQTVVFSRSFHIGSLIVFFFAIAEELSQLAFSTRTFDLVDMLFDLLGIGILSSVAFRRFILRKLESLIDYLKASFCLG